VLSLCFLASNAQDYVYIPPTGTVYVGDKSAVGIFGNFINDGNLSMPKDAKVYFLGKIFKNSTSAKLTDATTVRNSKFAGNVVFQQPNPTYGDLGQQILEGGYTDNALTGPAFSSITIDNPNGVWLTSDVNVLDAVNFQQGHVYLNKYVAALGDSNSFGGVNGFNQNRFFVTGTGVTGGSLKISSLASCCIVTYPIGPTNRLYTPLQMRNTGGKNDFYVRAFNNVYSNATSGTILTDTTLKVTWDIHTAKPGTTEVEVLVQNDKDVETATFSSYRDKSYISIFRNNQWEQMGSFALPQTPGTITSSAAIYTAIMHFRKITIGNQPMYITKRARPIAQKYALSNAFSPNGDGINDRWTLPFLESFPACRVQLFDRNGGIVFTSQGYSNPWNGTRNGQAAPVGTYYYVIDLRNGEKPLTGYVVLLR
jgi:gliding motility-associated-like protein